MYFLLSLFITSPCIKSRNGFYVVLIRLENIFYGLVRSLLKVNTIWFVGLLYVGLRNMGGWGVLNLEYMNTAFLCKWYWKCTYINSKGLWQSLIAFKYSYNSSSSHVSAFWQAVTSVSHFLLLGAKRIVGNGHSINFWLDNWYNDYLLSIQFPLVYAKTKSVRPSLSEVWNGGQIKLNLSRGVSIAMRHEKSQLLSILQNLRFTQSDDLAVWVWEPTGLYTIKSLYTFLCFGGVKTYLSKSVWSLKIPLKHKLFLWMLLNNKILTKDNLCKRNWTGDITCVFCSAPESVDHLFFKCPFISTFWKHVFSSHPNGTY
jgi:zinc-binding in reverse transcriptase